MIKVKPYSDYNDFDQEWLGSLPAHWKVMRTKLLFDLVTEPAPVGNSEELLSVYTALGVKPRKELEARGNKASSTDNYWRVEQGDIIVNKLLAWMGAVGISEYKGVTSPAYDILRHKEDVNPYFYNYLFRNPIASKEFKRHSRGIMDMRLRLYFTRFGDIKLPFPPIEEQNKIVEYLQFKLKRIDRFIRKKKQLIKLLNEQKAAIINQAVTKGLDPNAIMKPSSIEWLGDIPEHWEEWKLNRAAKKITQGPNPNYNIGTPSSFFRVLKTKDVYDNIIHYKKADEISQETFDSELNAVLIEGDILITIVGHGSIGKVNVFQEQDNTKYIFSRAIGLLRLKPEFQSMLGFIKAFFHSASGKIIFDLGTDGSTGQEIVKTSFIKRIKIPLPPISEQSSIVEFVNHESNKINTTISTIEKEITLTQEYKTTLIAEAVTGKIDVRDFEIPKTQDEETYEDLEEDLSLATEGEVEYQNEDIEE